MSGEEVLSNQKNSQRGLPVANQWAKSINYGNLRPLKQYKDTAVNSSSGSTANCRVTPNFHAQRRRRVWAVVAKETLKPRDVLYLAPVTSTPTISCPLSDRISSLSLIFPEQAAGLRFLTSVTQMQPTSVTGPSSLLVLGTPFFRRCGSPKIGMFPKLRPRSLSSLSLQRDTAWISTSDPLMQEDLIDRAASPSMRLNLM